MTKKTMRFLTGATAMAIVAAWATTTIAQPSKGIRTDEIVVTAQRRTESITDVPLTVNVLSGKDLTQRGITSLQDLASMVPGLDVFSQGGGKQLIQIRGINSLRGSSSLVGIYMDETPLTGAQDGFYTVYADAGSLDLQRIEVLKGPQGTLFGEGAMSGVIRYMTNDPKLGKLEGGVDSTMFTTQGGAPSGQIKGALNVPLSDSFAIRFAGEYQNNGGWIDDVGTEKTNVNSGRIFEGRVKALYQPTPDLTVVGLADIRRNIEDSPSYANVLPYERGQYRRVINAIGRTRAVSELDIYSLRINYDLGFADLMSNTAHLDRYSNSNLDQRYYAINDPDAPIVLEIENSRYLNKQSMTSQELRLSSKDEGAFHWVLGGIYKDDTVLRHFQDGAVLMFPPSTTTIAILIEPIETKSKSWAVYGDASYTIAHALELGGGLRYYNDKRSFTDGALPRLSGTFRKTTYRGFVKYQFAPHANIYANIGNGFRSGGFNAIVDPAFPPPLTYAPERSMAYEVGLKASLLDNRLDVSVAGFQQYYRGQLYDQVVLTPVFLQYTTNGGNTRIRGMEWLLSGRPTPSLRLSVGGTIMDSTFIASTPEAEASFPPGTSPLAIPKYSIQLSGAYNFMWSAAVPGYIDMDFSTKGKLRGGQGVTRIVTGPQSFLNVTVGATFGQFDLALFARNLLNEDSPYYPTLGGIGAVPRPRQIGVRGSLSF